jgi:hypothetical protein
MEQPPPLPRAVSRPYGTGRSTGVAPPVLAGKGNSSRATARLSKRLLLLFFIGIPLSTLALLALGYYAAVRVWAALDTRPKVTLDYAADGGWANKYGLRNRLDEDLSKRGIGTASGQPLTAHITGRIVGGHRVTYAGLISGGPESVTVPDIELHLWITSTAGTTLWERRAICIGKAPEILHSHSDYQDEVDNAAWGAATDEIDSLDLPTASFVTSPPAAPPPGAIERAARTIRR